ncbi:FAD-dependent oxidoreductase [Rudanella paleaurantiibacter]|uniref:FAD-dependent oxidoreductase n=1 Tax=Rudanella paleaurantiibacter TaxID=2614655 RepID=A0A7J5TT99_9BACT|nr:FAD-dependent oxidoreductase [Rudanella paleaurantiibacter]KAB7726863.1 FAD-dependent oxidoreductase [Rudanella paleaurantiibacter]
MVQIKATNWIAGLLLTLLMSVGAAGSLRAQSTAIEVDVCVYGATSAGVMAAYTAKKLGHKVLLIEPGMHLGGLSSGGLGYTDIGNKYVITGLARDFYRRLGKHYGKFEQWVFEPHVAKKIFNEYLREAQISVSYASRIVAVRKNGTQIEQVTLENANRPGATSHQIVKAKVFIDCSYEGDLMAGAGVSYTVGRESNELYKETYNGVQLLDHHQFPDGIDPYRIPGNPASGLLWGISPDPLSPKGTGDSKVQAYNFRICLTNNPANRIPITRPADYDSTRFELLARVLAKQPHKKLNYNFLKWDMIPNQKTDINNYGPFSTDLVGMNHLYLEADYATRARIIDDHKKYNQQLLYFLGNDPRVPVDIRTYMAEWGYPKDEYEESGHWSPQLYIREARRMLGAYVMTQHNCEGRELVSDGIARAAYTMDSHNCQRIVVEKDGQKMVKNEGDVQVGGFGPYPIAYRSITPKPSECTNLLVPVCLSASHIAYGSIRMEPVFMVLGQSAAVAATLAIQQRKAVQAVEAGQIQEILRNNPLADGSPTDLLIDNDVTPDQVKPLAGTWSVQRGTIGQLGGAYAASALVSDGTSAAAIQFRTEVPRKGRYRLFIYYPATAKAPVAQYKLTHNRGQQTGSVNLAESQNDWVALGVFELEPGTTALEIQVAGGGGPLVADAVLLVPAKTKP